MNPPLSATMAPFIALGGRLSGSSDIDAPSMSLESSSQLAVRRPAGRDHVMLV